MKNGTITIRLDSPLFAEIEELATRTGTSKTFIVKTCLRREFANLKRDFGASLSLPKLPPAAIKSNGTRKGK